MIYILLLYFIKINQVLENRKPMNQQPKSTPFVCRGRLREGAYSFFLEANQKTVKLSSKTTRLQKDIISSSCRIQNCNIGLDTMAAETMFHVISQCFSSKKVYISSKSQSSNLCYDILSSYKFLDSR